MYNTNVSFYNLQTVPFKNILKYKCSIFGRGKTTYTWVYSLFSSLSFPNEFFSCNYFQTKKNLMAQPVVVALVCSTLVFIHLEWEVVNMNRTKDNNYTCYKNTLIYSLHK